MRRNRPVRTTPSAVPRRPSAASRSAPLPPAPPSLCRRRGRGTPGTGAVPAAPHVAQHNLVSDQPGHARLTDPSLVNAWGLSHGPNTPLWVSDNGTDVSTLYTESGGPSTIAKVPLTVSIPGGAPTGQVFNDTKGFVVPGTGKPAAFIFDSENGVVSAWNPSVSPIDGRQAGRTFGQGAVYKGLALVHSPFGPLLLADRLPPRPHRRLQPPVRATARRRGCSATANLPRGYAPFDVAAIAGRVIVTYAKQDSAAHDDVHGRRARLRRRVHRPTARSCAGWSPAAT